MKCAGKPHMRNHLSLKPFPSHLHLYKPLMRNYPSSKTVSETFPFTPPSSHLHFDKPLMETTPLPRLSLKPFPSHLHVKPWWETTPHPRLCLWNLSLHTSIFINPWWGTTLSQDYLWNLSLHTSIFINVTLLRPLPPPRYKLHLMCMCCSACASETGAYEKMYEKTGVEVQSDMYQLFPMYWLSSWYKLDLTCISFSADAS